MMHIGLIGGQDIKKYTVADILWKKISELSGVDFIFTIFEISNFVELCKFVWAFDEDKSFVGFNVALPWKQVIKQFVDADNENKRDTHFLNVVYKKDGQKVGSNTDVLGICQTLTSVTNPQRKHVLILGAGGAGYATASYLAQTLNCSVCVFDVAHIPFEIDQGITVFKNYSAITQQTFDIIINATPVGKFFLDERPSAFSLPIDIDILASIIHKETILQEMNYFPHKSQFLKFGESKQLTTISGVDMLVYQAVESFKLYTGMPVSLDHVQELITYMTDIVKQKEYELF